MITILIEDDELKVKEKLAKIMGEAGYSLTSKDGSDAIRLVKKDSIRDLAFITDSVVALEDQLFDEKKGVLYKSILEVIEKPLLEYVLKRTEGNQFKAAKILGINRNTMRAKIKKLGINTEIYKI